MERKRILYVGIMLCLVLAALAAGPHRVAACSGEECGCGEASDVCFAECAAIQNCLQCQQKCVSNCARAWTRCVLDCCGQVNIP